MELLEIFEITQGRHGEIKSSRVYCIDKPFDAKIEEILIYVVHRNNMDLVKAVANKLDLKDVTVVNMPPDPIPDIIELPDPDVDVVNNWNYWPDGGDEADLDGGVPYDEYTECDAPVGWRLVIMGNKTLIIHKINKE